MKILEHPTAASCSQKLSLPHACKAAVRSTQRCQGSRKPTYINHSGQSVRTCIRQPRARMAAGGWQQPHWTPAAAAACCGSNTPNPEHMAIQPKTNCTCNHAGTMAIVPLLLLCAVWFKNRDSQADAGHCALTAPATCVLPAAGAAAGAACTAAGVPAAAAAAAGAAAVLAEA